MLPFQSIACAIIVGRAGKAPKRISVKGREFLSFPVAVQEKGADGKVKTHWHLVRIFVNGRNNLAGIEKAVRPGTLVVVAGTLKNVLVKKADGTALRRACITAEPENLIILSQPAKKQKEEKNPGQKQETEPESSGEEVITIEEGEELPL